MILNQILLTNSVGKYMEISVENLCVDIGGLKGYLNCQSGVRMRKMAENYFKGVFNYWSKSEFWFTSSSEVQWKPHNMDTSLLQTLTVSLLCSRGKKTLTFIFSKFNLLVRDTPLTQTLALLWPPQCLY